MWFEMGRSTSIHEGNKSLMFVITLVLEYYLNQQVATVHEKCKIFGFNLILG